MSRPASPHTPSEETSDEALAWVVRLNSGEATTADWRRYRAWRALSPEHEAAAVEAEAIWNMAGHVHRDPETGRVEPGRRTARVSRRQVLGGLAGTVVLAGGAPWIGRQAGRLMADEATGLAETRRITLPDRTLVSLNARSALDADFSRGDRRVELKRGQGHFGPLGDARGPGLAIHARPLRIDLVAGGGVDVNLNMPRGQVAVSATGRAARVQRRSRAPVTDVPAGARAVFGADGRLISSSPGAAANALAWEDGVLLAEDMPLEEIVAGLRPWYPGWILLSDDDAAATLKVNAVLDLHDAGSALEALATGLPIRLRRAGGLVTMISPA